ncbi:6-phosphogluconolactonase [Nakamurella lactea]|uniref:6-phosphogluconolactonase n=1 Tax=Nakamurella lactea TaxID=459515 RepID=UPI0004091165|nr:6-phosphogluconolactonase [Nakamurella lactea]
MFEFRVLPDAETIASAAATDAVNILRAAIAEHGQAVWVVAGGTSPNAAYRRLAADPADLDWSKVTLVIGDERLVPFDHPDSNWGQVMPLLTAAGAVAARALAPNTELPPAAAAEEYQAQLEALPTTLTGAPRLDLVWVGMGEDGHTLSLFPGRSAIDEQTRMVVAVTDSPKPPPRRITLTLRALDATGRLLVFATGAGKRNALSRVRAGEALPVGIAADRAAAGGAEVTWLVDSAADGAP